MSRCPDWWVDILSTVRCQDVKMSILVGGHLMARELSRVFWAIVVRCQDVKMIRCLDRGVRLVRYSRFLRPSREMSRCQDVRNCVCGS